VIPSAAKAIGVDPVSGAPFAAFVGCAVRVQFCSAPPLVLEVVPRQYFAVVDTPIGLTLVEMVADVVLRSLTSGSVMTEE
jgi:hypothetical protein